MAARQEEQMKEIKGALTMSKRRYKEMKWRLDVELARRNMSAMTEPKFMICLDTFEADINSKEKPKVESFHIQSDFANLKRVQTELQRALAELASPHSQRLVRYIK